MALKSGKFRLPGFGIAPFRESGELMQKIATDIQTFERLRVEGYTYVDKTAIMWSIANGKSGAQFFMARPRRFGKTLAVTTFRALFEGRRDLFRGLAIDSLEWDWTPLPVLHLNMNDAQTRTVDELHDAWYKILEDEAKRNGVPFERGGSPAIAFKNLINALAEKSPTGRMVLLVDEYDKPLLGHLCKPDVDDFRDALKTFYSVIKGTEEKQRFMFMTGVSRFSKVSIFSDLNNLNDWTMERQVATLFGYTHDEVRRYFGEALGELAEANGKPAGWAFDEVVKWYDGYRFHYGAEPVINPVSLGLCLKSRELNNYWSTTAMPTFLIDTLKRHPLNFATVDVDDATLGAYEPANPKIETLLFQTGYLTIGRFEQIGAIRRYDLKFPNMEVENSFVTLLVGAYTGQGSDRASGFAVDAIKALYAGDARKFADTLRLFFKTIPYDLTDRQDEQTWQAIVYAVLRLIGVNVGAEVKTADGRVDMAIEMPGRCFVVEFKLDRPAAEAIAQIREKGYADIFAGKGRPVSLIGVSFSSERRTIAETIVEDA